MALARDVSLLQYGPTCNDQLLKDAADDLSKYDGYRGPIDPVSKKVTPAVLFRGKTAGDLAGDYVSQFLLRTVPFGAYQFKQQLAYAFETRPG